MKARGWTIAIAVDGVDTLALGEVRVTPLPRAKHGPPREALVLRDHAGELRVYLNRCQHLPIPLDGGSRRFLSADGNHLECGTHGALYRLDDGHCVDGPCEGESLERIAFTIEGATVRLLLDED